jgi:hypothetical protein
MHSCECSQVSVNRRIGVEICLFASARSSAAPHSAVQPIIANAASRLRSARRLSGAAAPRAHSAHSMLSSEASDGGHWSGQGSHTADPTRLAPASKMLWASKYRSTITPPPRAPINRLATAPPPRPSQICRKGPTNPSLAHNHGLQNPPRQPVLGSCCPPPGCTLNAMPHETSAPFPDCDQEKKEKGYLYARARRREKFQQFAFCVWKSSRLFNGLVIFRCTSAMFPEMRW